MKKLFFIVGIIIVCNCCKQNNKESAIIRNWIGKEVILPELSDEFTYNEKAKIVTYVNGDCYSCLERLNKWDNLIKEVNSSCKNLDFQFYFYIVSPDTLRFNILNEEKIKFLYPVILDRFDEFNKKNKLPGDFNFHTMLLNSANEVELIGSPLMDNRLKTKYVKKIIALNKE